MEKLNKLISQCKGGVYVTVNQHRDNYEAVEQYLENTADEDIDRETYLKMKEFDTIIELQFYPRTPVGFYKIYHYDLEAALDEALRILKEDAEWEN